jgi:hypothetical protein
MHERTLGAVRARLPNLLPEEGDRKHVVSLKPYCCSLLSASRAHSRESRRSLLCPRGRAEAPKCSCSCSHPLDRAQDPRVRVNGSPKVVALILQVEYVPSRSVVKGCYAHAACGIRCLLACFSPDGEKPYILAFLGNAHSEAGMVWERLCGLFRREETNAPGSTHLDCLCGITVGVGGPGIR